MNKKIKILISLSLVIVAVFACINANVTPGSIMKTEVFKLESVTPRIFTPDLGDVVRFSFENPNFSEVTIRIFNITGAEVKNSLIREQENIMVWDGKDEENNIVSGGIYIYQIEADGEVISGAIVVAR